MKIFSNFDTKLSSKLTADAKAKYGQENMLFVSRDKIYRVIRIYIPVLMWCIISIALLILYYGFIRGDAGREGVMGVIIRTIVIARGLYLRYKVTYRIMDYYMDYAIITPRQITVYDQDGVLKRTTRSVDTSKIKTINIEMDGWLCSIFNFGSIVFLSEGDSENGDIKLNYITNPVRLRDHILELMELDERKEDE